MLLSTKNTSLFLLRDLNYIQCDGLNGYFKLRWKTILHGGHPQHLSECKLHSAGWSSQKAWRHPSLHLALCISHSPAKLVALSIKLHPESTHFSVHLPSWFQLSSLFTSHSHLLTGLLSSSPFRLFTAIRGSLQNFKPDHVTSQPEILQCFPISLSRKKPSPYKGLQETTLSALHPPNHCSDLISYFPLAQFQPHVLFLWFFQHFLIPCHTV